MCNAFRHPAGCECGFGPPYPEIDVSVRKLINKEDMRSSKVAQLDLKLHIPKAAFFHLVDNIGKRRILSTAAKELQRLANKRFGKGKIEVVPIHLKKGSIEFYVLLVVVGGAYTFFKDYESLRIGVSAFVRDIKSASSKLNRVIRRKYLREERRSLIKKKQIEKMEADEGETRETRDSHLLKETRETRDSHLLKDAEG